MDQRVSFSFNATIITPKKSKALFIWRKVVMGGRITLPPKLHCMGEGPGEPGPPLFFDQIFFEKKKNLETAPLPLISGSG